MYIEKIATTRKLAINVLSVLRHTQHTKNPTSLKEKWGLNIQSIAPSKSSQVRQKIYSKISFQSRNKQDCGLSEHNKAPSRSRQRALAGRAGLCVMQHSSGPAETQAGMG
jgi:hypothetical protein